MMSYRRQPDVSSAVKNVMTVFKLKNAQLCNVMARFRVELEKGLMADTHETAIVKCYQTFIQDLPTGDEMGTFLVVDLGGLNFRILLITLEENYYYEMDIRSYSLPYETITGTSDEFFDFIADCVALFLEEHEMKDKPIPLGFCFGFPVKLESLTEGILVEWSKKFNVTGVVGKDVAALLRQALDKRNLNIAPIIIVNDTIGCLLACAFKDSYCRIGVIIGTGTNACYLERIENIGNFKGDPNKPFMIINTEWSNFGSDGTLNDIRNEFDLEVDKTSVSAGIQTFEKMTSSIYVSELVRLTIIKCAEMKLLFEGETSEMLRRQHTFLIDFIYEIEGDNTRELNRTFGILEVMGLKNACLLDCVNVKYICKVIFCRSAHLIAATTSVIINKMAMTPVTIAFNGNIYRKHPTYRDLLKEKIRCLINPQIQTDQMLSEDGSGKGTAVVMAGFLKK